MKELNLTGGILGHVGGGNIHTVVAVREDALSRASELSSHIMELALSLGGTISAEHGVGLTKRPFMARPSMARPCHG